MARVLSLPVDRDEHVSSILSSYRVAQGVLHNPRSDRRTTEGIFHVAEGGLPIPEDKRAVPQATFSKMLALAFQPPRDHLRLPFTATQPEPAECFVSLLLRPIVCPEVPGYCAQKTMEVRFFAPGSLVSNLDFIETIFGNAGDPFLPENDAALDAEHWTGHTGCVILAPHLTKVTKQAAGLPHWKDATERQRRDGMCWQDEWEFYNSGQAFKLTCRDQTGVIVTIIADNYYGYCKKEVKTQISFAANLLGSCEEEHAGGALVFPSFDLGEEFSGNVHVKPMGHSYTEVVSKWRDAIEPRAEGYSVDKKYHEIIYVPEDARFDLHKERVLWPGGKTERSIKLLPDKIYVRPSGYKVRMEKPTPGRAWRLVGTVAEGILCHKPCTVSGGGKSEISKPITDAILTGPVFVADFKADLERVAELIDRDYSDRFVDPARVDKRSILAPDRSLGSVIKLLTEDEQDYQPAYNAWLAGVPQHIKEFVCVVKRYYKPEWNGNWRDHLSVDIINGQPGNELKCDNRKLITTYLRVGFEEDGSWRTFGLRKDFHPAVKIQAEDDITASVVVPPGAIAELQEKVNGHSLKFVKNCELRLFQRPDDAIHRGYDKQTEADFARRDNFFSNYEPLNPATARELTEEAIGFHKFTPPIQSLILEVASVQKTGYFVSPAHPRIVDGKPTKNPRYLQVRPDFVHPRDVYLAEMGAQLRARTGPTQKVHHPVAVILAGRRNNPPEGAVRSLAVFNPVHYLELPELFMEFICSMTGKSPSTTGAGSEGALTKGPFNALPPIIDLNNALVSWLLTGHSGFVTAAGYVGPKLRVDHDVSLLAPEIFCRMSAEERDPKYLIANRYLDKCVDFDFNGRRVLASRLGYRINARFLAAFFGRVFNRPSVVFTDPMLKPELQGMQIFADGIENIIATQKRVAQMYFDDGSIAQACPPLRALLLIMRDDQWEGKTLEDPAVRKLFTLQALLSSDWYAARLTAKQKIDRQLWRRHVDYLERFSKRATHADEAARLGIPTRLIGARKHLAEIEATSYLEKLRGTIGRRATRTPWRLLKFMPIHAALHHRTTYRYDRPVTLGPQIIRLRPAPHSRTRILSYSLSVSPKNHFINWQQDPQSNYLARLVFAEQTTEFIVDVDLVAEMSVLNPFDFFLEPDAEEFPFTYDAALRHELEPFHRLAQWTPQLGEYANEFKKQWRDSGKKRTIDFLVALNQRLWADIKYLIRLEPGVQTPDETLQKASGSCRDSSWLLCQILRRFGLASRFVSGYLIQLKPDVKSLDGPSGAEKDFTDLHAWCEVYLPGAGWIGLDATSGLLAGEGHIPLAATPDPQSAAPISGLVDEAECKFSFDMCVTRVFESPRVTLPYSDEQWQEIDRAGQQVDALLQAQNCRLTMGGEPTFVSIDDMDGAEWNTVALGPTKRKLADDLMRRLKTRFSSGALLHYGQGKWYPGESLPRWAFACYWRKDGHPIWHNEDLFALETKSYGHADKHAEQFIYALAQRLQVSNQWIMPGFEDAFYYLWKERRLPTNVDPFRSNLKNEEDRARLAKVFEQGLDKVVGYVLPLQRNPASPDAWISSPWFLRPERCYLIPGDSAMGLRLPLDSIPWVTTGDYPYLYPQDPMEERPPLPPRPERDLQKYFPASWVAARKAFTDQPLPVGQKLHDLKDLPPSAPARGESAGWITRTALCVEPRLGRLHVFMPPTRSLEDYLALTAAVEDTAELLDCPVVIEGYTPPHDARLNTLKVTPDPGVIEVNMHPSSSWPETKAQTEGLYEEARLSRLGTEKFMLDGRHTGSGGGNHIVLGGATPADSPLLRRPDLLRSLLSYWQNHPSLSFLFSGMFIGPTSQSPRVDEARNDSLYELDLAFQQVPDHEKVPPWLVDRLFRNLLIDATGNTHRAEFCIDKLYSPEGSSGRLGLLEMRAFEMPPHARMSLAQQLLLRSLIAKFWQQPYTQNLVRWGTDIHDRWMLPHFIWQDFQDVASDLQSGGLPIKAEWFAPQFEFRFPQIGDLERHNIVLELRTALEPWHVLGEEAGPGGTVRYVDSSLERLQIKARGLTPGRHVIAVNRHVIPLHPTGTNTEFVAGVRYRAWQPPNCLQPTIGVHAPLLFDIVDTWTGRSVGGCAYHVSHPGGLSYETFPVNAYEAESRRLGRFFRLGHTPGPLTPTELPPNPEFPFTMDMRRITPQV